MAPVARNDAYLQVESPCHACCPSATHRHRIGPPSTAALITEMAYPWIFLGCYPLAAVLVVFHFMRKNNAAAALLGNPTSEAVTNFHRMMWRKSALLLVWATFVFGSVAGGVISLMYWLVSK